MTETVAAGRVGFSGPAGPDMLRIPAEPRQLTHAGQQLGELADHLAQAGEHLTGADGEHEDRQGHTTSALMSVATWNGRRLTKDANLLRELSGAVERAAQVIGDIQAHDLPQLRRRWAQAQDQFMTEMRHVADRDAQERQQAAREAQQQNPPAGGGGEGGGGHRDRDGRTPHGQAFVAAEPGPPGGHQPDHRPVLPHPDALLQQLDDHLVQPHAELFRELHGAHVAAGGGGDGAFLSDSRTEHTISAYRQSVRSVLDEFSALVQRVRQADRAIEERSAYPAADRNDDESSAAVALVSGDMVSGVTSLRHLVRDLRDGAQANNQAHDHLRQIATALADGRLPVHGGEERERFGADWTQHFQRRTERLRTVCSRVDDVLEKFSRLDAECAAAIRAH